MLSDTSKAEVVVEGLRGLYLKAVHTWVKCQWPKTFGSLKLIQLKNQTTADIQELVVGASARVENLLEQLGKVGYTHSLVLSLADAAEWKKHGHQALEYLSDVEFRAAQAEDEATRMLESLAELNRDDAEKRATEILRLESIRVSGKPVWGPLCYQVLEVLKAFEEGWVPRWRIAGDVIGNEENEAREDQCYTTAEWLSFIETGSATQPRWTQRVTEGDIQWYLQGIISSAHPDAI